MNPYSCHIVVVAKYIVHSSTLNEGNRHNFAHVQPMLTPGTGLASNVTITHPRHPSRHPSIGIAHPGSPRMTPQSPFKVA